MPRTTATDKATEKKPAAKPGPKPGAKAAAKVTAKPAVKPAAAPKEPVEKPTRNIGEVETGVETTLGALPKGLSDILPDRMREILDAAKPDTKVIRFGSASLPNELGYVRVYSEEQLKLILDPLELPQGYVQLESNKTLGSKSFYIHTLKLPAHPKQGEYTDALRDAYDVAISEALRDGGFADFVPAAVPSVGVVEEINPMVRSMMPIHGRLRRQSQQYTVRPIGESWNRNSMYVETTNGQTAFRFVLDNLIEVSTSRSAVNAAIEQGTLLVTVTVGEREYTAAVFLDQYPVSLALLDQNDLLSYLNDAVRSLLVTSWFDKLIGDAVVTAFDTKFVYVGNKATA